MLLGQTVMAPTAGAVYYGPWMRRQGNGFVGTLQVLLASAGASTYTVTVEVQTKNEEDPDPSPSTVLPGSMSRTDVGLGQASFTGCLELVRYKYTVTGVTSDRWVHMRMNPPIWQPN